MKEEAGTAEFIRCFYYSLPPRPQKCYGQLPQSPLSSQKRKMWELSKPAMSDKAMPDGFSDC